MSVRHTSELSGWTGEPGDPEEKRLGWRHRCGGDATKMTFESVCVDEATRGARAVEEEGTRTGHHTHPPPQWGRSSWSLTLVGDGQVSPSHSHHLVFVIH